MQEQRAGGKWEVEIHNLTEEQIQALAEFLNHSQQWPNWPSDKS